MKLPDCLVILRRTPQNSFNFARISMLLDITRFQAEIETLGLRLLRGMREVKHHVALICYKGDDYMSVKWNVDDRVVLRQITHFLSAERDSCPVCTDVVTQTRLPCGHALCEACIARISTVRRRAKMCPDDDCGAVYHADAAEMSCPLCGRGLRTVHEPLFGARCFLCGSCPLCRGDFVVRAYDEARRDGNLRTMLVSAFPVMEADRGSLR